MFVSEPIGYASATKSEANSVDKFRFWIKPDVLVNLFDIVVVEHYPVEKGGKSSYTYGLVTNIHHFTDASSHFENLTPQDSPEKSATDLHIQQHAVTIGEATVLSNSHKIYMPIRNEARVYFADQEAFEDAFGIKALPIERRIPAGLIKMSNHNKAIAYLDRDFVLGPEAGHVNISGISGLAATTSYAMFLIQSILQLSQEGDIGVVLFNTRYDDLLHLHEPRHSDLVQESEKIAESGRLYRQVGLRYEPWSRRRLHYFFPWGSNSHKTGLPNTFADDASVDGFYAYPLRQSAERLDLLFADVLEADNAISYLIGAVQEGLRSDERIWQTVQTWDDLLTKPPLLQQGIPQRFREVPATTVGRFIDLLRRRVETRQSGIFVDRSPVRTMMTVESAIADLRGGHTYVFDVARLTGDEQMFVVGDVLRTIHNLYSGDSSSSGWYRLPKKTILFIDELNKYAPPRGEASHSPILKQILNIAEGRQTRDIILFTVQQFLSTVHTRISDISATKIFGRTDNAEITDGNFRILDSDLKSHLTRLEKTEMILSHPLYRQPVKVEFPIPPFRQGRGQG